jgi:Polycystin cation channel
MNATKKQSIDNYVAVAIVIAWIRFFAYLLLIKPISVLLLTLFKMVKEIVSFGFIMV